MLGPQELCSRLAEKMRHQQAAGREELLHGVIGGERAEVVQQEKQAVQVGSLRPCRVRMQAG